MQYLYNLYNYLGWLLSDEDFSFQTDGILKVSDTIHEIFLNLSEDVMFSTSYIALPKHVGLGLHLIKEFRSKFLLIVMNRFGNTISYQDAQRYLTIVADEVDKQKTHLLTESLPIQIKAPLVTTGC